MTALINCRGDLQAMYDSYTIRPRKLANVPSGMDRYPNDVDEHIKLTSLTCTLGIIL